MAASWKDPPGSSLLSLKRRLGTLSTGGPSRPLGSEKGLQSCWSQFSTGQRPKGTFNRASSHLLQQLIRRPPDEEHGEGESGESSKSEMLDLEEEFDGVLTEEAVAQALHELGRSGSGTEQVYLHLTLSGCDLTNISILCGYVHLQKLDLSVNKIEDLSCVSCMPYLLELNASQNKLTTFFNFKPPKNLKKVDFSCNQISEMCDLSAYHSLTKLILDNNEIEEISGLEMCSSLTHLSLANNKITTVNGLNMLPIKILCLNNNQIEKITGLEDLKVLQNLDLSHNQISSLQGLEDHNLLEVINLEDNKIAELDEIEYIENLPILRIINLLRNPIQEKSEYWLFVIFMLLRLTELDQKKIKVEEKVAAVNKYDPPPEVVAAQDHLTHVVNSVMRPQRIFDSTLPSLDAPYPMLILAGPQACGKRELAHRLCRQFNTYFRYGACHTTRPPYFGEGDRVDYHFISQEVFDEMLNMGKFILTFNYGNYSYGLNRDTVEGIARDGLASCVHMEIEGVRSLKFSYFEPRYVLVVPMNKEKYEGYLRRKGLFSRAEIEFAISRVDLYIKINQKFPGYFDAVINADDLDVAYQKLSQLIREYLGLAEEPAKGLAPTAGAPSSKKTVSGVPAHLVPSPRRLTKLQADGQITEHLSGQVHIKVSENQNPAPSQNQELAQEGETQKKELSPNRLISSEPTQQPSSPAVGIPQQTQDISPHPMEEGAQQSDLSPKITTTTETDVSESKTQPSEVEADGGEQSSITTSHMPLQHPDPPPSYGPHSDQDEESGEAKVAPSSPPPSEPSQGPASLSPQKVQDVETEPSKPTPCSSHQVPPEDPSHPDSMKKLGGGSQPPLKEETHKSGAARASTPYPELVPPQDSSTTTKETQDREHPVVLLSRGRLAPTRLPQPRTLAPLQSRRPTPKLLSPSREEAAGTNSDQTMIPSPRPLPTQEADPSKLPAISPPHSTLPPNLGAHATHTPQQDQEEKVGEVRLPLISPSVQDQVPQHIPNISQEDAPTIRLPQIPTPFIQLQLPATVGVQPDPKPAKEKKAPKAGHPSSKKIPDMQASPQSKKPMQQKGTRKKTLPLQRDIARGPAHLRKAPPRGPQMPLQLESPSKPAPTKVPDHPSPSPSLSSQGNQRQQVHMPGISELPHTEPQPKDPQSQEEKREKTHHSRKKAQTNLPPSESRKGPSLKRENTQGLSKENKAALSGDQPIQEGLPAQKRPIQSEKDPTESIQGHPAPVEHPRKGDQVYNREKSWKRETVLEPSGENSVSHKGTSQIRESSVQRDRVPAPKLQTKDKQTRKNGGIGQDKSIAVSQGQMSAEEQGSWTGRLRARGSQSTKV
ncbi:leucine-rich repeat and guanylate kinase domain-containing protein isoform X2 [Heterocephalus glaber]|uniref:Leucine-rich repeat and guanylate kinase domain-containing protein n=1 Tax=Heterocephalus glaber TaxID=10181 RepID=A0AAX6R7G2_HETGA|nr:leucine-rich repeat and guanylate kinase domain-containing protein isoform X2 [Heterocephalus glaber]